MAWVAWLAVSAVVALLTVGFVVAAYVRRWTWAGLAADSGSERAAKTVWDWLQLMIVPAMLAIIAVAYNASQASREHRREDRRIDEDRTLARAERQSATLLAYFTLIGDLLQRHRLSPGRSQSEAAEVARTITLEVVSRVNGRRRGRVVRFLAEAGLLRVPDPVVSLRGADLRHAELTHS